MNNLIVICYKESVGHETDSGTLGYAYTNEDDAIKKIWEITDGLMNKFIDDEIEEEEYSHDTNRSGNWQKVTVYDDTYEYWTKMVTIKS